MIHDKFSTSLVGAGIDDLPEIHLTVLCSILVHYEDHRCGLLKAVIGILVLRSKLNNHARQQSYPFPLDYLKDLAEVALFEGDIDKYGRIKCKLSPARDYNTFINFLLRQKNDNLVRALSDLREEIEKKYPPRRMFF